MNTSTNKSLKGLLMATGNALVTRNYTPSVGARAEYMPDRNTVPVATLIRFGTTQPEMQEELAALGIAWDELKADLNTLQTKLVKDSGFSLGMPKQISALATTPLSDFTVFANSYSQVRNILAQMGWVWEM
jgi:hypothetical protein